MKKSGSILRAVLTASLLALIAIASPVARAQETADRWAHWDHWSGWWYGLYGGVNINLFSGALHNLGTADTNVAATTGFDAGSGLGLALGGIIEYNNGKLLGGNLMFGYDSRGVIFDTKNGNPNGRTTEKLTARVGYFTIEPNLRINLGLKLLHFTIGPSFRLLLSKGYDYSYNDDANPTVPVTSKSDFANIRSFITGAQAGLGYDIPLHDYHAASQIIITPFAQFHISQDLLDVPAGNSNKYGLNTIRVGVQVKYGVEANRPIVEDPNGPAPEFALRAPNVVTESRKLNETFPLRNYIFFDAGSTEIPSRYKTISTADAATFREDQLIRPTVETGGTDATQVRSRRQMEVYYQVMNVFADRLRKNPSATIKLTGSANGDAATGKKMAEKVRDYLVSTFGIDAARIKAEGRAMPGHKSGSGSGQGEDRKLVDAENYRV
ncbi:MAG: outer membrane beta-barrel protein, partial [Candidatus Kapaibacterium sp.]